MKKKMLRQTVRAAVELVDRCFKVRELLASDDSNLSGDRAIEWSWVVSNLPRQPSRILDVGCVESVLTAVAARFGHQVTAVDLREIEYEMSNVEFIRGDICDAVLDRGIYETIVNCSTIEHIGLIGRYGASASSDADLAAMRLLRTALSPEGRMILTIPVGCDAVISPWHRIYGENRLRSLLDNYSVQKEEYWLKVGDKWKQSERQTALQVEGNRRLYGLGLFVLVAAPNAASQI